MDKHIEQPSNSEESAFGSWYEALYPSVARVAFGITLDWEEAKDIADEAFLRLWQRRDSLRPQSNEKAWVMRVAVNLALSRRRAVRAALRHPFAPAQTRNPEDLALANLEAASVQRALARLSARERAVLVLRFQQDCGFAEISNIMGSPESTLRTWTARALAKLRQQLAVGADTRPAIAAVPSSEVRHGH